jgi:hypothetical protein
MLHVGPTESSLTRATTPNFLTSVTSEQRDRWRAAWQSEERREERPWTVHIPVCREGMMLHVGPTVSALLIFSGGGLAAQVRTSSPLSDSIDGSLPSLDAANHPRLGYGHENSNTHSDGQSLEDDIFNKM